MRGSGARGYRRISPRVQVGHTRTPDCRSTRCLKWRILKAVRCQEIPRNCSMSNAGNIARSGNLRRGHTDMLGARSPNFPPSLPRGFHPRALAALSEGALTALSTILAAVETSGQWPRQVCLVTTALLPKPKGGFRPVGIMPAIYRLWSKARRDLTDPWEARHSRAYLSSAKGNGPIETMWRMGVRQERSWCHCR